MAYIVKLHTKLHKAAYALSERGEDWSKLFRALDTNHDQTLCFNEMLLSFRRTLNISGEDLSDSVLESFFSALDTDHSGSIDIAELVHFLKSHPPSPLPPPPPPSQNSWLVHRRPEAAAGSTPCH